MIVCFWAYHHILFLQCWFSWYRLIFSCFISHTILFYEISSKIIMYGHGRSFGNGFISCCDIDRHASYTYLRFHVIVLNLTYPVSFLLSLGTFPFMAYFYTFNAGETPLCQGRRLVRYTMLQLAKCFLLPVSLRHFGLLLVQFIWCCALIFGISKFVLHAC